jgi:hypothetical protein
MSAVLPDRPTPQNLAPGALSRPRLAIDRRLLWLIAAGAALVLGELALRGWEAQQQLQAELDKVRSRASVLEAGTDTVDWTARTRSAEAERSTLQQRLWRAPSEAQAQARLRDWLSNAAFSAGAQRPTVSLLPIQQAAVPAGAASGAGSGVIRVRATVGFELAPRALEDALLQIEAGGQLARVDSLTAGTRTRRVEMTVSVPVLIDKTLQGPSENGATRAAPKVPRTNNPTGAVR